MAVTLKAVAAAAEVSIATVSNAFNRPEKVNEETRERVLRIAASMGYEGPNPAAMALRLGRTNSYGVLFGEGLTFSFTNPYAVAFLAGTAEVLDDFGASLLVIPARRTTKGEHDIFDLTAVDGLLTTRAGESHPDVQMAYRRGLHVVSTSQTRHGEFVAIDEAAAGLSLSTMVRHLGHRDFLILHQTVTTLPGPHLNSDPALVVQGHLANGLDEIGSRIEGMAAGLAGCRVRFLACGPDDSGSGQRAAGIVTTMTERPTAVLSTSDAMALGFLDGMANVGLEPGVDLTVTGFDDVGDAGLRGLTTVHQPIEKKARMAARMLIDRNPVHRRVTLPTELRIRSSSGEPCLR